MGATNGEVITLDTEGLLTRWRSADGNKLDSFDVPGGQSLSVFGDGLVLVRTPQALLLAGQTGVVGQIPYGSATAVSFGPDTNTVGVGYADGTFRAVDVASGTAWGEVNLAGSVQSVAWSPRGNWVVAAGIGLTVIAGDGKTQAGGISGLDAALRHLTVGEEGALAAAVMGHNQVALFDLVGLRSAGTANFRRSVGGAAFGPNGLLGIGLDDADALRLDVYSGKSHRTEPHQGRGRNIFNFENKLDSDVLRGATAKVKAGGSPIARYEGPPEESKGYLWSCLGALAVSIVVCGLCAGCSGLVYFDVL
ncbi:MAG: hypothetical protein GWP91_24880 [Rhodobacterales bacterium]|nr:hypothetical protein [Rhodobacterales bacterium]